MCQATKFTQLTGQSTKRETNRSRKESCTDSNRYPKASISSPAYAWVNAISLLVIASYDDSSVTAATTCDSDALSRQSSSAIVVSFAALEVIRP